jgi:hypothetical protein
MLTLEYNYWLEVSGDLCRSEISQGLIVLDAYLKEV